MFIDFLSDETIVCLNERCTKLSISLPLVKIFCYSNHSVLYLSLKTEKADRYFRKMLFCKHNDKEEFFI